MTQTIEPWTRMDCARCGCRHTAARSEPRTLAEGAEVLCPGCEGYDRGFSEKWEKVRGLWAELAEVKAQREQAMSRANRAEYRLRRLQEATRAAYADIERVIGKRRELLEWVTSDLDGGES